MKHTKGPWTKQFGTFTPGYASTMRIFSGDKAIADVFWGDREVNQNAHLIAAAPEMLEALLIALKEFKSIQNNTAFRNEFNYNNSQAVHKVEQIIKKIQG